MSLGTRLLKMTVGRAVAIALLLVAVTSGLAVDALAQRSSCSDLFARNRIQAKVSGDSTVALINEISEFLGSKTESGFVAHGFESETAWKHSILASLAELSKAEISRIRDSFPELMPAMETAKSDSGGDEVVWGFAFRDLDFMKERIRYLSGSADPQTNISTEVLDYLLLGKRLSEREMLEVYGPLFANYIGLSKGPSHKPGDLPRKRMADAVVSFLAARGFRNQAGTVLDRYQAYLDKARVLTGMSSDSKTSKRDARELAIFFERIRRLVAEARAHYGKELKFYIFGSSINGRETASSDIDFTVFQRDQDQKLRVQKRGAWEGEVEKQNRLQFYDRLEASRVSVFQTPEDLIEFGLRTNAVVIEVSAQESKLLFRKDNRFPSDSASPEYESFTLSTAQ